MMERTTIIEVPVLIIGFNRPEIIRQCITKLRESMPKNLYFACDGPRTSKENEHELVNEVRSIMENESDWSCQKHFRYNESNKGCEVTESEAITWVLEENEYVIVIEDDIIAPYSFLKFAQEMLYKYKDDNRVFQVTSDNTTPMKLQNDEDYCFSMYGHIWGWATWRRAWNHFDLYVTDFGNTMQNLKYRNDLTEQDKKHVKDLCKRLIKEEKKTITYPKHTWDVIWSYVKWRDGGLTIVPKTHLSSNVGVVGLHTKMQTTSHFRPYSDDFEAIIHPRSVQRNITYDEYHYEKVIKQAPFLTQQVNRIKGFLKRRLYEGGKIRT